MNSTAKKQVLVYDGDCGICRYWVNYWQRLTGDSVEYRPYQNVAGNYPVPDQPPKYIRALVHEYHFSNPQQRKENRQWWERKLAGIYHPVASFINGQIRNSSTVPD